MLETLKKYRRVVQGPPGAAETSKIPAFPTGAVTCTYGLKTTDRAEVGWSAALHKIAQVRNKSLIAKLVVFMANTKVGNSCSSCLDCVSVARTFGIFLGICCFDAPRLGELIFGVAGLDTY